MMLTGCQVMPKNVYMNVFRLLDDRDYFSINLIMLKILAGTWGCDLDFLIIFVKDYDNFPGLLLDGRYMIVYIYSNDRTAPYLGRLNHVY